MRGTLLDATTGQPVPSASVLLLRLPDSTAVADAQTAETGPFALQNLQLGAYVLRANALGCCVGRRAGASPAPRRWRSSAACPRPLPGSPR